MWVRIKAFISVKYSPNIRSFLFWVCNWSTRPQQLFFTTHTWRLVGHAAKSITSKRYDSLQPELSVQYRERPLSPQCHIFLTPLSPQSRHLILTPLSTWLGVSCRLLSETSRGQEEVTHYFTVHLPHRPFPYFFFNVVFLSIRCH